MAERVSEREELSSDPVSGQELAVGPSSTLLEMRRKPISIQTLTGTAVPIGRSGAGGGKWTERLPVRFECWRGRRDISSNLREVVAA